MNDSERHVQPTACSALGMRGPGGSVAVVCVPVLARVPPREIEVISAFMFLSFVAHQRSHGGF
jgi:hypothetical protein